MTDIHGAKGGAGTQQPATEAPDSLHSVARARILDLVSEGEILGFAHGGTNPLQDIYLNETPVANADGTLNFTDVQVDSRVGSQSQTYMPGFGGVENEVAVGLELKSTTPWTQSLTDTTLSAVRIRLSVPSLQKSNTSIGDITGYTIAYKIEVATDGGSFATVINSAFTGKTTSKYERTHRVNLPAATTGWVVRVTRLTANANLATIADTTTVESYTSIIDDKFRYPNSALVGIIIDAQQFSNIPTRAYDLYGRIISVPANYDPVARTYATTGTGTSGGAWDGTFKPAWTNNPAWIFYDLATNSRYGLGQYVNAALLNKWALYQIGQYCDGLVNDGFGGMEPRFTCNLYLQTQADAYKVLQDLSSVFRGMAFWAGGAIQAVADMPSDPVYTYTQANVIGGKFTYSGSGRKTRFTTALVSWNDPNDFGRAKVEYVPDNEGIARYGIQQTSVTGFGCTSQAQAHRIGLWTLLTSRLETETVTFGVGLDGTIAAPGQIIRIADSARAGKRQGGRIHSATTTVVTVDAAPTVAIGDTLTCTMPTGVTETHTVSAVSGNVITVGSAFSVAPEPESAWVVESSTLAAQTFRVISVLEDGQGPDLSFAITALAHNASKFDNIDIGAPLTVPPVSVVPPSSQAGPTLVTISSVPTAGQVVAATLLTVQWDAVPSAVHYVVEYQKDYGTWIKLTPQAALSADIPNATAGTYVARVQAINASNIGSQPTASASYAVADQTLVPGFATEINNSLANVNTNMGELGAKADALRTDVDAATAAVQQEVTDRTNAINTEANARATAILNEQNARIAAVSSEANARATAILNEQNARIAAVSSEATTRQSADDSLATQISLVSAGSGEQFDSAKIWYFDADLESWTGNGAPTIVDGWLRPANHATDPYVTSPTGLGIAGQSYRFSKVRIKKVGTPAWQGELRWRLAGDAAGVWRGPTAIPEPPFDANGVTAISWDDIAWWPGTIDQIRIDLSTAQSASSYYLIDWIALGRPTPGAGVALVQDETAARVAADSAEATQRSTLATQMRGAYTGTDVAGVTTGLLYSEKQARSAADSAMASDISSLQASVGNNTAAITAEQTARANGDSANATSITNLSAKVGQATDNLVSKGTFADGTPGYWVGTVVADGTHASQANVLQLTASSYEALPPGGAGTFPVAPGEQFDVQADVRTEFLTSGSVQIGVHVKSKTGGDSFPTAAVKAGAIAGWSTISGRTAPAAADATAGRPYLFLTGTVAGSARFTNIRVVRVTKAALSNAASILTEQTARANADSAMAADIALLGAHNAGKTAFILDQNKVQIDGTTTFAQMLSGLSASDGALNTRVDNEQAARISGDNANASSITSLTARMGAVESPNNNLMPNPTGALGFNGLPGFGWIGGAQQQMTTRTELFGNVGPMFCCAFAGTGAIDQGFTTTIPQSLSSQPVTISADMDARMVASGQMIVQLRFLNSSGTEINTSNRPAVIATNGSGMKRYSATGTTEAGTASIVVMARFTGAMSSNSAIGWRNIKLERGTVATPFTDNATVAQSATVTQALIANVGPSGAYAQATTMLDVNGRITGVSQTNNGTTGDFRILADKFSIESPAGGARTEYSAGNWRVYDSLGNLRVRMGIW